MSAAKRLGRQLRAGGTALLSATRHRSTVPGAVVLAYHDVLPDGATLPTYAVSVTTLRRQLDVVARLGLKVVPLRELAARLVAGEDVTGQAAVVFDDALVGVHHLAMPELAARGWPATLHPVVDRLGVEPPWWPGSQRTMTWDELGEATGLGLDLGGHGTTHACLPCLADAALAEELRAPRERLEELVGRPVDELAYPYGHYDERVRDAAREAGYRTAYTFLNGRVGTDLDAWRLPRITMHEGIGPFRLAHQLSRRAEDWPRSDLEQAHTHDQPGPDSSAPA